MAVAADLLVRVKGDTSDVNSKLGALGSGIGKLGKLAGVAAAAGGAAIAAMAVKSVVAFANFEQGMKEVFTLLPSISEASMGKMEDDVKSLSKKMGILPDTVIPALYQAISAGVPEENVFDFLELASMASIGGVTNLETAVDGITSTVNAFGAEVITAAEASDVMLTSVRLGKTTFEELSKSLFQVNPVAAGLGIEFGNVTAALAALTSQGVPTSVAATQIRGALVELGKEGTAASDTFKELSGKSFVEFIAAGGDMKGAFDLMAAGAADMGVGVGDLFGSVEAGMAVIALTSEEGAVKFGESMDAMEDATGATQAAFETMDQGLSRSLDRIKATVAVAVIDMGAKLAPFVAQAQVWFEKKLPSFIETAMGWFEKLISAVQNFVAGAQVIKEWFTGLPDPIKKVTIVVGLLVVALAALYANPVIAGLALVAGAVAFIGARSRVAAGHVDRIKRDLEAFSLIKVDTLKNIFGKSDLEQMRDAGLALSDISDALSSNEEAASKARQKISEYLITHGKGFEVLTRVEAAIASINDEFREQADAAKGVAREVSDLTEVLLEAKRVTARIPEITQEATDAYIRFAEGVMSAGDDVAESLDTTVNDFKAWEPILGDITKKAADTYMLFAEGMAETGDDIAEALFTTSNDFKEWELQLSHAATGAERALQDSMGTIFDLFDAAPERIKISVDQMIANIREQREMAKEFESAMRTLMNAGLDAVVEVLLEAGPAAVDQAVALAADMNKAFELELELDGILRDEMLSINVAGQAAHLKKLGVSMAQLINFGLQSVTLTPPSVRGIPSVGRAPGGEFSFHKGGIVPGPRGKEVATILLGGETVLPTHKTGFGGGDTVINVIVNVPGFVGNTAELAERIDHALTTRARQSPLGFLP